MNVRERTVAYLAKVAARVKRSGGATPSDHGRTTKAAARPTGPPAPWVPASTTGQSTSKTPNARADSPEPPADEARTRQPDIAANGPPTIPKSTRPPGRLPDGRDAPATGPRSVRANEKTSPAAEPLRSTAKRSKSPASPRDLRSQPGPKAKLNPPITDRTKERPDGQTQELKPVICDACGYSVRNCGCG